ncbi:MAG: SpoIIE family protein phosphatase [Phycisphaerales bacterium]|nr:SpoIIE family protein phosphatase [Phycisphaerales bacterium]
MSRRLAQSSDLSETLGLIIDTLRDTLDAERASVFQYDAARNQLFATKAHGLPSDLRLPATAGIVGQAATSRQIINIPDAYADARFNPAVDRATGFRTRGLLTIPLIDFENHLAGVAQVLNKRHGAAGAFSKDDEELAEYLAGQAAAVLKRAALLEARREKERLQLDMQAARVIQRASWRQSLPEFPGFDIAGASTPADETGGDAFDVIDLRPFGGAAEGFVLLADATGHGVQAALPVAQVLAMSRMAARLGTPLEAIGRNMNAQLCGDLPTGRFVTAFLGELLAAEGTLRYISFGQGPILHLTASGPRPPEAECLGANAMPMGIDDVVEGLTVETIRFEPGDVVALLSDGFFEAKSPAETQMGHERVIEAVRSTMDASAAQIMAAVRAATAVHAAGVAADDDQTALIIKRVS